MLTSIEKKEMTSSETDQGRKSWNIACSLYRGRKYPLKTSCFPFRFSQHLLSLVLCFPLYVPQHTAVSREYVYGCGAKFGMAKFRTAVVHRRGRGNRVQGTMPVISILRKSIINSNFFCFIRLLTWSLTNSLCHTYFTKIYVNGKNLMIISLHLFFYRNARF